MVALGVRSVRKQYHVAVRPTARQYRKRRSRHVNACIVADSRYAVVAPCALTTSRAENAMRAVISFPLRWSSWVRWPIVQAQSPTDWPAVAGDSAA